MTEFNKGWWNCFLSYTDNISFTEGPNAFDFARDQMNDAGVSLEELKEILKSDYAMSDRTRTILKYYKDVITKK